jgi:hypothetical protein
MAMPNLHSIPAMAIAIVATALISISATIGLMQWAMVIPAADKPTPTMHKLVTDTANRLDGRITEALGNTILCIEEVQALRRERTPSKMPAAPALKKAGG